MSSILRRFARAIALLAAGAAAYYAAPVALRLVRPTPKPPAPLIAISDSPASLQTIPHDRRGDAVLINSLAEMERWDSVEAELFQSGYLLGQPVEAIGVYRQKGRGFGPNGRKFATSLQGRIASSPARLSQVSNGLFLYTDLAWSPAGAGEQRRSVTRVDLRRIRQELIVDQQADDDRLARGQAAAQSIDPMLSAAFGGLPMLVESLGTNFHFGTPRKMRLADKQLVFAMIGHWRPDSRATLVVAGKGAPSTNKSTGAARRLPHHVMLVLGASDLFPYLIEYRSPDDPLSAAPLADNDRLQQSGRPLLRMEFRRPRFGVKLADKHFAYPEAGTVDRRDITDQRIATLRQRQKLKIAAQRNASAWRR